MFHGRVESWNLRDTHMMETLDALMLRTARTAGDARAVVWAHNSHLGDARATQMGEQGELNLGQLVREKYRDRSLLIGFTTHTGSVTAARICVRPSLEGSYERLFHDTGLSRFLLSMDEPDVRDVLMPQRLERAIGVIYRPQTERLSHYFRAALPRQFDVVLHIDTAGALEPLERWSREDADLPETYPHAV
jgi:erythromycin esterase-like protein